MAELLMREAADHLAVSFDTVRRRVRRGELRSRRDERGRVLVILPDATAATARAPHEHAPADAPAAHVQDGLTARERIDQLQVQVTWLQARLERAEEERAELRRLLAGALQTLPPPKAPPDNGTAAPAAGPSDPVDHAPTPAPRLRRSFWARVLRLT